MHARRTATQHAVFPSDMAAALRHHRWGAFEEARWGYLRALEDGPRDSRPTYLLACLDIHAGDLEAATACFRRGIRRDLGTESTPPSAEVAVPPAFRAALAVDPRPEVICRQLGARLATRGEKLLPALVALQAWLHFAPQDIDALECFADVAGHIGDQALSAALLRRAQGFDPGNPLLPFKRGNALNALGEHRQALAAYEEAIRIDPGMCAADVNAAATLQKIGRTEAAEGRLRERLADHPHHPDVLFTLAEVLSQDGRPEEAVQYYAQTVAVAPEHTAAWLHQAHAWKRMGLTKKAAEAYRRASTLAPERPEIHFGLGATLHGLRDYQGAEAALAQAVALDPDDAAACYLLNAVRQTSVASAPRVYVEALFDRYAGSFDRHMKGLLQYRIPAYLRKYLKSRAKGRERLVRYDGRLIAGGQETGSPRVSIRLWAALTTRGSESFSATFFNSSTFSSLSMASMRTFGSEWAILGKNKSLNFMGFLLLSGHGDLHRSFGGFFKRRFPPNAR